MSIKRIFNMLRDTFKDWSQDKAPRLAAALSYYTVFSLAPLLVIVIAIVGFIIGNNAGIRDMVIKEIQSLVGAQGAGLINTIITNSSRPRSTIIATIIGIVTLLLGATGVLGQLQDALNTIWNVKVKENAGIGHVIKQRFLTFAMILGIAFLLLVSLVVTTALSFLNRYLVGLFGFAGFIAQAFNILVSLVFLTLIFAMLLKFLPDVKISWRDVWLGAIFTAILFVVGQFMLSLYLGSGTMTSTYGAAGSLVALLLWVYYSGLILFFGAEFTQIHARYAGRQIVPASHARLLTEEERAEQGIQPGERASQGRPAQAPSVGVQPAMMPVTGQPDIHPHEEHMQYEPANPNSVIPVIVGGTLAGIVTIGRVIQGAAHAVRAQKATRVSRRYTWIR